MKITLLGTGTSVGIPSLGKLGSKLLVGTDLIKQEVMFPRIENQ